MRLLIAFVCAVSIAGCTSAGSTSTANPGAASTGAAAIANGHAIFTTGRDSAGVRISAEHPPLRPFCAACHRADGSGGVHLPGGAVSADLRHKALVTQQKHPYTLSLLERAISTGVDNDGKPLDPVMPRWRLSQRDLHDVAEYVFTKL